MDGVDDPIHVGVRLAGVELLRDHLVDVDPGDEALLDVVDPRVVIGLEGRVDAPLEDVDRGVRGVAPAAVLNADEMRVPEVLDGGAVVRRVVEAVLVLIVEAELLGLGHELLVALDEGIEDDVLPMGPREGREEHRRRHELRGHVDLRGDVLLVAGAVLVHVALGDRVPDRDVVMRDVGEVGKDAARDRRRVDERVRPHVAVGVADYETGREGDVLQPVVERGRPVDRDDALERPGVHRPPGLLPEVGEPFVRDCLVMAGARAPVVAVPRVRVDERLAEVRVGECIRADHAGAKRGREGLDRLLQGRVHRDGDRLRRIARDIRDRDGVARAELDPERKLDALLVHRRLPCHGRRRGRKCDQDQEQKAEGRAAHVHPSRTWLSSEPGLPVRDAVKRRLVWVSRGISCGRAQSR